ncbi:MAG: hypothetical protein HRT38_04110 [Alteromonadaceae bacterium]|nr:hypothetical protein [Alteromonadaceae bacterium]
MQTLDGNHDFSGRVGCKSNNNYLSVNANVSASGNVTAYISIDSNLDGSIDQNGSFSDIAVVCANGYQKCTKGARDCETYRWLSSPGISSLLMQTDEEIASVHSCYCVNHACSPNIASHNRDEIIRTLGNGVASVMQQNNPYYTISAVRNVAGSLAFYGQDLVSCDTEIMPELHKYKNKSRQLLADGNSATSDDKYIMVESLVSQTGNAGSLASCSIRRNFSFVPVTDEDVLSFASGQGRLRSCGLNCLELTVGIDDNNTFDVGGRCVITNILTRLKVGIPDKLISATLVASSFEEALNLSTDVGGVIATFNGLPVNAVGSSSCTGNRRDTQSFNRTIDITDHFKRQGFVNLRGTLASYRGASYYYKIRFIINAEIEKTTRLSIFAQGRDYITCEYTLSSGTVSCVTDGIAHKAEISNTWNVNELCGTETTINKTSDANYSSSIATGQLDLSFSVNHIQTPSCANAFTGKIKLTDITSSSDTSPYLSQRVFFTLNKPTCELVETVNNACTRYEGRCLLEREEVDGMTTINKMLSTGLTLLPSSRFINGTVCSSNVIRNYFVKERTYGCGSDTTPLDIDTSRFIKPVVAGDSVSINMANSGSGSGSVSIPMPEIPTHDACIQSCEVRSTQTDTRVNLTGEVSKGRKNDTLYKKSYRACEAEICPVQKGETMIQSCGCLNEFGKAMTMMQLIRLAGKDMICTDGNTTTDQL